MTPADLTLEDIAADETPLGTFSGEIQAVLAREIIALRTEIEPWGSRPSDLNHKFEQMNAALRNEIFVLQKRLDQLESQARPFQESGELAVGRESKTWYCDACNGPELPSRACQCTVDHWKKTASELRGHQLVALRERDAAIARAEAAEKKLAAAEEATRYEVESTVMVEADLERLRPYVQHLFDCPQGGLIQIVGDPCTCGLTDALDGSGQHE